MTMCLLLSVFLTVAAQAPQGAPQGFPGGFMGMGMPRGPALQLNALPTHPDWVYETGEEGLIDIEVLVDGKPVKEAKVTYTAGQEKMATDLRGEVVLKKGKGQIRDSKCFWCQVQHLRRE